MIRTLRLVYDDIDQWLTDYGLLLNTDISNLQGICIKSKDNSSVWNFMSLGADDFLTKPVDFIVLKEKLRSLVA